MDIKTIGVIGSGTMGNGIAHSFAQAGFTTILVDLEQKFLDKAIQTISKNLDRQIKKEKITEDEKNITLKNISTTTDYSRLSSCQLVIEAVFENIDIKKAVLEKVSSIISDDCILASNTSTISLSELAAFGTNPERIIGMHFFNPVPMMKLIEIVIALQTGKDTIDSVLEVSEKIGKVPVCVNDSPGFVLNRIFVPMINEAILTLENGLTDAESIDNIMKLGAGHPMGPLALADLIGLDVILYVMEVLHKDFGDSKYRPASLLRRMVAAGSLGRKTGRGFHNYMEE